MTKREAAIVSAYTGFLCGQFGDLQRLADELMLRPTLTHEFAKEDFVDKLRDLAKPLFIALDVR